MLGVGHRHTPNLLPLHNHIFFQVVDLRGENLERGRVRAGGRDINILALATKPDTSFLCGEVGY